MAQYLEGGEQTTINSTITELFPALAFNAGKKPFTSDSMYDFVDNLWQKDMLGRSPYSKTFAAMGDRGSAYDFIEDIDRIRPAMLDTKLSNAVGITKYLYELHSKRTISKVVWGYRAKPAGVPNGHAGDIFVFFKTGEPRILGVSLKAGSASSSEPKMNSYVRSALQKPMWKMADPGSERRLADKLWENVYSQLPHLPNDINRSNWIDLSGKNQKPDPAVVQAVLRQFKRSPRIFDELYDEQNATCRRHFVRMINSNYSATKKWIKAEFNLETQGTDEPVPLILVKAVRDTADAQGDQLAKTFSTITDIKARINNNSVQEWFIDVYSGRKQQNKLTLLMTIRSDSEYRESKQKGKLGTYMMLKLLYRGYK